MGVPKIVERIADFHKEKIEQNVFLSALWAIAFLVIFIGFLVGVIFALVYLVTLI
jgi:type II secretory pathway component PulF